MIWIVFSLSAILVAVALLHTFWAFGSPWPMKNDQELVTAVVGASGRTDMPAKWQSAFVAVCSAGAAVWPYFLAGKIVLPFLPQTIVSLGGWALMLVFLGRGLIGLTPWFKNLLPVEPFVSLNRKYYSPLCLIIGTGFLALLF
jgi:uncharacterized protein DUF3995